MTSLHASGRVGIAGVQRCDAIEVVGVVAGERADPRETADVDARSAGAFFEEDGAPAVRAGLDGHGVVLSQSLRKHVKVVCPDFDARRGATDPRWEWFRCPSDLFREVLPSRRRSRRICRSDPERQICMIRSIQGRTPAGELCYIFSIPPRSPVTDQRRSDRIRSAAGIWTLQGPASDRRGRARSGIPHVRAHARSTGRGQGLPTRRHARAGTGAGRRACARGRGGAVPSSIVEPIAAGVEGTVAYRAEEYVAAESLDVAMRHYAPASFDTMMRIIGQLAEAIDVGAEGRRRSRRAPSA